MSPALYALQVDPEGLARVRVEWPPGRPLIDLLLLSSVHQVDAIDELVEAQQVQVERLSEGLVEISQVVRTTLWDRKRVVLRSYPERLEYWCEVTGRGLLDRVSLFEASPAASQYTNRPSPSGYRRPIRARSGWQGSRGYFSTVFSPAPNTAFQQYGWPGDSFSTLPSARTGLGEASFFTPAPFAYGLGEEGRWLTLGLGCSIDEATFSSFEYEGGPLWSLTLRYDGQTRVAGSWRSPTIVLLPTADEFAGLAAYRDWLRAAGQAATGRAVGPDWWGEPIWSGWGEQVAQAQLLGASPDALSTQQRYADWLKLLDRQGLWPGTIVVDRGWQAVPGRPEPDPRRWPELASFIARRQQAGQRVLLWQPAWELADDGAGPGLLRRSDGDPLAGAAGSFLLDPTAAEAEPRLRQALVRLLAPPPRGLGADGLKLDRTHLTPHGPGYAAPSGPAWGSALLHRLLALTYGLAKEIRAEALIEAPAANPLFLDCLDLLRLNDLDTDLRSVVEPMTHRARVARASGFALLDTDGWPAPSRAALLEYAAVQPSLGIPALYYASRLERSGETLEPADYAAIAAAWRRYRAR
jgi:hypothetical protein